MPHNWASAEFIRLVRHLLVFERGETLELLSGLPENWIYPGAVAELEKTPTRFGPVSLKLEIGAARGFDLRISCDMAWPRKPTALRLRLPPGSTVRLDDQTLSLTAAGWCELPWAPTLALQGTLAEYAA
jgi:hypothetical protein